MKNLKSIFLYAFAILIGVGVGSFIEWTDRNRLPGEGYSLSAIMAIIAGAGFGWLYVYICRLAGVRKETLDGYVPVVISCVVGTLYFLITA